MRFLDVQIHEMDSRRRRRECLLEHGGVNSVQLVNELADFAVGARMAYSEAIVDESAK